jgi:NMD protein affecting ribosome stability and mRNA decay
MKTRRSAFREGRKEQKLDDTKDSYRALGKLHDPAQCPRCGAAFVKGRWTWGLAPADAVSQTCPACQRIEDNFPAGAVTLKGPFFAAHRDEVLNIVTAREARAREEHPLQRIIGVEPLAQGVLVTTTDIHLARGIARSVHDAFKGSLDITYNRDEQFVRATWSR